MNDSLKDLDYNWNNGDRTILLYGVLIALLALRPHVRMLYRFYQFVTTLFTTDFYIIKDFILKGFDVRSIMLHVYSIIIIIES